MCVSVCVRVCGSSELVELELMSCDGCVVLEWTYVLRACVVVVVFFRASICVTSSPQLARGDSDNADMHGVS